jgi:hypothetical protein
LNLHHPQVLFSTSKGSPDFYKSTSLLQESFGGLTRIIVSSTIPRIQVFFLNNIFAQNNFYTAKSFENIATLS